MAYRDKVLSLYRQLMRLSKTWTASDPSRTSAEKDYIRNETKLLFRENRNVPESEVPQYMREAEARLEMALHYKNPYPRLMNFPQTVLPPSTKRQKSRERILAQSQPIYLKSYKKKPPS